MEDQAFDAGGSEEFQPESDDLKKKAAAQSKQSAQQTPEDQSRGALHYGKDYDGDTSGSDYQDAEAPTAPTSAEDDGATEKAATSEVPTESNAGTEAGSFETNAQDASPEDGPESTDRGDSERADTSATSATEVNARDAGNAEAAAVTPASARSPQPSGETERSEETVIAEDETPRNAAPTEISLSDVEIAENEAGAIVGELTVTDQDLEDAHEYTVSDNRFEIVDGYVKLKDGLSLNHEEIQSLTLEVTVTDSAGNTYSQSFDIAVTNVNETPADVQLSHMEIAENADGAVVGTLSVADVDIGDNHSFSISDDRFEIVDGQVKLKDGISLNHEDTQAITLDVTVTDSAGETLTQSFDIAVTDVNEAPTTVELSNTAVAENVAGAVVGTVSVVDADAGDSHTYAVSDDRFEVIDGQVKLKDGIDLDHEEATALTLDVTATDSSGASHTQSFDISVADMPDVAMGTGFHAKYFDVNERLRSTDDIDWNAAATHEEIVQDINYQNSSKSFWEDGSKDTFGVQITGNIEVTEAGVFNFHIGGDDGVVLFIDGKEVVENDGLHGFRTRSGEIELEPGTHVIEVRYFENYGHAGLKVEWDGPGIDGRELLTPPALDDLQTVNGMPLSVNLQTDADQHPDGAVEQVIDGLPPGTVLTSGEMTATVDETGSADISDWDTSLLHITPPIDFTGHVDAHVVTTVTLENGDTAVSTTDLPFDVDAAEVSPPTVDMQSGFRASYYDVDHSLSNLDQIDWDSDPTKEEVVGEINYKNGRESFWEGGDTDTFGARITGEVTIEEGGTFKFFAGGDDGVVLYVNGVEVIENDGLHSYRTRSGEIELEPGTHDIEVRYFENYGHAGLKLEWEGPGIDGRELVQADQDLSVEENGTLEIGLTTSDIGPDSVVTMSGLPADTILISGEDTVVSDGSDIDLSGWDLDLVELMPPPGFEGTLDVDVFISDTAYNGQVTETTQSFEIDVGDTENATSTDQGDDAIFMADADQDGAGGQGWADDQESQGDDDNGDDSDDDVMEEPVADNQGAEQSYEMTDTYERNDW